MEKPSYEVANKVFDAIIDEVTGDSLDDFLDWRSIDADDYERTVAYLSEAIEKLR